MATGSGDVTRLLQRVSQGEADAAEDLIPLVYNELRRIAGAFMRGERPDHTLQPTALVNEAYLRLVDQTRVNWHDRVHFFRVASRLMRRILVDHARGRLAEKRGGGDANLNLDWLDVPDNAVKLEQMLLVDEVLTHLQELDPQQAQVVELHYFGGMTVPETATALGISTSTVDRDWAMAKAWMRRELSRRPKA